MAARESQSAIGDGVAKLAVYLKAYRRASALASLKKLLKPQIEEEKLKEERRRSDIAKLKYEMKLCWLSA